MKIDIATVLAAPVERVWQELQTSRLLVHLARPMVRFLPVGSAALPERWADGEYPVRMRLFGVFPAGAQTIRISHPGPMELRDAGSGTLARTWDHRITVSALPDGGTAYRDQVEVRAGVLTLFVWLFAQIFYRHRQRRWRKLAASGFRYP